MYSYGEAEFIRLHRLCFFRISIQKLTLDTIHNIKYRFLGFNVPATYYLQSIMRGTLSMLIAVLRGFVLSGILLYTLPLVWGLAGVCAAMPVSEGLTAALSLAVIVRLDGRRKLDISCAGK